jgi:hypothetical protein
MVARPGVKPKKGKARRAIAKRPAFKGDGLSKAAFARKKAKAAAKSSPRATCNYVRHGTLSAKSRRDRATSKRTVEDFYKADDKKIVDMLLDDNILRDLAGELCPHCGEGVLGALKPLAGRGLRYRCRRKPCHKLVLPHHGHPMFSTGTGKSHVPLQQQAAVLFHVVHDVSLVHTHMLTGKSDNMIRHIFAGNELCRTMDVEMEEKKIVYGGDGNDWKDVEADEVDLRGEMVADHCDMPQDKQVKWEQWGGVVQRGDPSTLMLTRLKPKRTTTRAPGPGPMRAADWKPFAERHLKNRSVILHTDGAKAYTLKVEGMLHDHVVHKVQRLKKDGQFVKTPQGKNIWLRPRFAKEFAHKLASGRIVKVMGGTQIIDRFWRHLRAYSVGRSAPVGSKALRVRVRSAQWAYWHRGQDLWLETGRMLQRLA